MTANAPIDASGRQGMTAFLNTDGKTVGPIDVNPSTHSIKVSDGSTGSDHGGTHAGIDDNGRQTLFAYSSANDGTLVALYRDSTGKLLIQST